MELARIVCPCHRTIQQLFSARFNYWHYLEWKMSTGISQSALFIDFSGLIVSAVEFMLWYLGDERRRQILKYHFRQVISFAGNYCCIHWEIINLNIVRRPDYISTWILAHGFWPDNHKNCFRVFRLTCYQMKLITRVRQQDYEAWSAK